MIKIAIIMGSVRPGRKGEVVAQWVESIAAKREDAEVELLDLRDFNLPIFDEPEHPAMQKYSYPHTKAWSAKIDAFDAYVFVTPEYNHSLPGVLKNAIDYLYREWNNKSAGFVGYGVNGGALAVEQLRLVMGEIQVADVRAQVNVTFLSDFENYSVFKPRPTLEKSVNAMLDQVIAWGGALKTLRTTPVPAAQS